VSFAVLKHRAWTLNKFPGNWRITGSFKGPWKRHGRCGRQKEDEERQRSTKMSTILDLFTNTGVNKRSPIKQTGFGKGEKFKNNFTIKGGLSVKHQAQH
jgi:hypothetical protein